MKKATKNEEYFNSICSLAKMLNDIDISDRKMRFSKTQFRLLNEIVLAKNNGERLISSELSKRLGITRSAVSQVVKELETQGVVKRVGDDKDKKIAYIEVTEQTIDEYNETRKDCVEFIGKIVNRFGEAKFDRMCKLFEEFADVMEEERKKDKGAKMKC